MSSTFTANPNAKIRIIEPTIGQDAPANMLMPTKKNVAAYARVSTEQDEQQNSYEAQVNYYTEYIKNRDDWNFVEVYADEGITGTNTKKRVGFKRMIDDAKAGKIDLILTKSISRFARNTVDTLTTVRELKSLGIDVWFEKENIHTIDPQGEIILTVMSSLAQEESHSISANVTWGVRKKMAEGQVRFPFGKFLGYRKGLDGRPEIVEEEAAIIRDIYQWFLDGMRPQQIAEKLEALGIKTPTGKSHWRAGTVTSILSNEKYKGDALLQKTITVDYLSKKIKKNDGEKGQFYIEGSHPAIIEPDIFDLVQYERKQRKEKRLRMRGKHVFSGKLVCGDCGDYYGHKVFRYNSGYHYDAWSCNTKYADRSKCGSPNIKQSEIESAFVLALRQAMADKAGNIINEQEELNIRAQLQKDKVLAEARRDEVAEEISNYRPSNNIEAFKNDYLAMHEKLEARETELNAVKEAIVNESARKVKKHIFIKVTKGLSPAEVVYDEILFTKTVEKIVVTKKPDGRHLLFTFTNGVAVDINLQEVK